MSEQKGRPYNCRFHPQAWVNDYAIEVDPEGETRFVARIEGDEPPEDDEYESDELRLQGPQWMRDWTGPFWVEVVGPIDSKGVPTWQGASTRAWRDRIGGILITHEDRSEVYLQPGDDADSLAEALDDCAKREDWPNLDVLLCDQLEGIEPPDETD